jgi:hypothetical protein
MDVKDASQLDYVTICRAFLCFDLKVFNSGCAHHPETPHNAPGFIQHFRLGAGLPYCDSVLQLVIEPKTMDEFIYARQITRRHAGF